MENSAAKENGNNMMQGLMLLGGMYEDSRSSTRAFIWDGVLGFSFWCWLSDLKFLVGGLKTSGWSISFTSRCPQRQCIPPFEATQVCKSLPQNPRDLANPKPETQRHHYPLQ